LEVWRHVGDPREELLNTWRSTLFEIERRIAQKGGDSQAPLDMVSIRDQARAEIERMERDGGAIPTPIPLPAAFDLPSRLDFAFQLENLRRDVASWQSSISRELVTMTDEQVRPLQAMLFEMSRRLDAITQAITTIREDQAVIAHRLGSLETSASSRDGASTRWLVHLSLAILVVTVAITAMHYLGIGGL
jgi:hypothetical protein